MYIILSPSHLPYIFLSCPYTTRPWHRDHLFSSPQLFLLWIIKAHLILSTFQINNMLQWSIEHIFAAHWVGLKATFHATVWKKPSQMPWTLTCYFGYCLWSCCVFTSPSMTWKRHSCILLHLKSAIFQSSDVIRTTLYHLQWNISA